MKKETIEEAAEKLYPIKNTGVMSMGTRYEISNGCEQEGFEAGTKWVQERSYTIEEVKIILDKALIEFSDIVLADIPDWFEQFKK